MTRRATPADRALLESPSAPRADLDSGKLRAVVADTGPQDGRAYWLRPQAGLPLLGGVEAHGNRRLFYELIREAALDMLDDGFESGYVEITDKRVVDMVTRDIGAPELRVIGTDTRTGQPGAWWGEVNLREIVRRIEAFLA